MDIYSYVIVWQKMFNARHAIHFQCVFFFWNLPVFPDLLKYFEGFKKPVFGPILPQCLVVATAVGKEQYGDNTVKHLNPLLPFSLLAAYIKDAEEQIYHVTLTSFIGTVKSRYKDHS